MYVHKEQVIKIVPYIFYYIIGILTKQGKYILINRQLSTFQYKTLSVFVKIFIKVFLRQFINGLLPL